MKIQCNVCETAEATVLCCADEAALCRSCDVKIHAANKLASKHQRVLLTNSDAKMPKCDICQTICLWVFHRGEALADAQFLTPIFKWVVTELLSIV
ncbi:B-box zinc finger protein 22-like protein [Tanacetum coccineum]|uniref:B-box zinc finger protein 22-like protein n=1 Tax=Tanacetum coccineum TaxID=301880 RepID=A0ABQ5A8Q5_9ASTR